MEVRLFRARAFWKPRDEEAVGDVGEGWRVLAPQARHAQGSAAAPVPARAKRVGRLLEEFRTRSQPDDEARLSILENAANDLHRRAGLARAGGHVKDHPAVAVPQSLVGLTGNSTLMRKQAELRLEALNGRAGRQERCRHVESVESEEEAPNLRIVLYR